jgi:hypothetical protein
MLGRMLAEEATPVNLIDEGGQGIMRDTVDDAWLLYGFPFIQ